MEEDKKMTETAQTESLVKKIDQKNRTGVKMVALTLLIVILGVGTGWFLSGTKGAKEKTAGGVKVPGTENSAKEAGLTDEEAFPDSTEGTLESGGISGEGTHHLVRDGGADKYVYLTSTVIDLESFTGKKVKIWGQTMSAKRAGWLMDVGKIKVIE